MSQILLDKKSSDSVGELSALTRTTAAYRRNAWLAVGGLVLFIVLYLSLAGWFTWTAYRIFFLLPAEKYADFWTITAGCLAAFMAFFMIKALFFIKRADASGRVEITQKDQPKLFAFLNEIADAAQAPRPRKVYVSPRVNACVFYDLSLLSFIFPSKKNLEIGLGLVNALSMGEFKSVLAHEFGHFAQRSAAVGRWVYIAQQIAAHLVARRDGLDHFLRSLAWSDPRVAWLAWILNLFIWTIRALIDTAFMLLIAAQRALSREMEFNADLVAVSQTGSDALINALHCLQGADDAWERALAFAQAEKQQGRLVRDIFVLQSHISRCLGVIRDDPHFGRSHIIPEEEPHLYRIFRAGVGQPPRMWLTHPLNHEREANAKRTYIRAEIDALNAWDIFQDAAILRERLTAEALSPIPDGAAVVLSEESIATLDKQFGREHLSARYHGVYYGRAFTCYAATTSELYANALELQGGSSADFYPESLKSDVETLRYLEAELMQLRGVIGGFLTFQPEAGGPMDKRLQNQELKSLLTQKEAEKNKVEARIQQHDRFVRGWCLRQAETIGLGWPDYLKGLLAIVHYAEHSDANIQDAREHLRHTLRVETATRKVNNAGRKRILLSANDLHDALKSLFANSASGTLDSSLQVAIGKETLSAMFGEFGLRSATPDNIVDWLNNVDGWTNHALGICDTLRRNALDLLLKKEAELNQNVSDGTPIELASPASHAPAHFERLVPGQERKKAEKLHWWARFQLADGRLAGGARLATALGMMLIIFVLLETPNRATKMFDAATSVGGAQPVARAALGKSLTVFNGLNREVLVKAGSETTKLKPLSSGTLLLPQEWTQGVVDTRNPIGTNQILAQTTDGQVIETLTPSFKEAGYTQVYNVAAALPLIEWTALYGNGTSEAPPPRVVSTKPFFATFIPYVFTSPPRTISARRGQATSVNVIDTLKDAEPNVILSLGLAPDQRDALIRTHARWDLPESSRTFEWLYQAMSLPDFKSILDQRLTELPQDVFLQRLRQDSLTGTERATACKTFRQAAQQSPEDANRHYLMIRCMPQNKAQDDAYRAAFERWPSNAWLTFANAYVEAGVANWARAFELMEKSRKVLPQMADYSIVDIVRIKRLQTGTNPSDLAPESQLPVQLQFLLRSEYKTGLKADSYAALWQGRLDDSFASLPADTLEAGRLLYFLSASDGASEAMKARARTVVPTAQLGMNPIGFAMALAAREGRDLRPYMSALDKERAPQFLEFIKLAKRKDPVAAETAMLYSQPAVRGILYSMGVILLGKDAPTHWRDNAKRLLFSAERPYFQ